MSQETLPTAGRISLAEKVVASNFVFALSRGNPAWDSQWGTPNPPAPPISATDVLDLIGYARPTIVGFLKEDADGDIVSANSEKFSVSATPTRWARIKLSLAPGNFVNQTLREIGLFIDPVIAGSVPPGQIIIAPADVTSKGRLFNLHWREPLPIEDGSHFSRNFVVRL